MKIAVVGGGLSGTLAAIHILRKVQSPVSVFLIEEHEQQVGKGVAYSSSLACQPLNVVTTGMSIFSENKNDFLEWLHTSPAAEKYSSAEALDFMPRDIFGKYVCERFEEVKAASAKIRFSVLSGKVTQISFDPQKKNYSISFLHDKPIEADIIILATGNEPTAFPAPVAKEIEKTKLLIMNPWDSGSLEHIGKEDTVFITGAGLTMIDMVMNLRYAGHTGKIIISSRHGLIPLPHYLFGTWKIDAASLAGKNTALGILQFLHSEAKNAAAENICWQAVFDAFRPHTQFVFQQLPQEEKKRFIRHVRHYWDVHRHRIPADAYDAMQEGLQKGNIEIRKGRIQKLGFPGNKIAVYLKYKNEVKIIEADKVINCTGPMTDFTKVPGSLLYELYINKFIIPDSLSMGIQCNENGQVIAGDNHVNENIFALGGLRRGSLWETVAVSEIRDQAEEIAALLQERCMVNTKEVKAS